MKRKPAPLFRLKRGSALYQGDACELLPRLLPAGRRVVVVTNRRVARLCPEVIGNYPCCLVGEGERNKNLRSVERLHREFITLGVDRSWFVLAVGGGIVCDVAGFVASTYMRGVEFGFVATTLLSQVDASVGGKNGVNVGGYKNMAGTFTQPRFVICDSRLLATLPLREFRGGLAEMVKAAIIGDKELFEAFEQESPTTLRRHRERLEEYIRRAIAVKAAIVERDEREQGERRLLNLGHTFGHAIEKLDPHYHHGEAVAAGLCLAADLATRRALLPAETCERIHRTIRNLGLPQRVEIPVERLTEVMARDKKGRNGVIAMILPTTIGHCEIVPMTLSEL